LEGPDLFFLLAINGEKTRISRAKEQNSGWKLEITRERLRAGGEHLSLTSLTESSFLILWVVVHGRS
jgi:hypothetical protein